MAYTITISTSQQKLNEIDNIQLKLIFNVDLAGTDITVNARENGIRIKSWGEVEWAYELDEPLLTIGEFSIILNDADGYLENLFIGRNEISNATDKRPEIQILVNGEIDYSGAVVEDGMSYSKSRKECKLRIDTLTEGLNSSTIDGNSPSVLGYVNTGNQYYSIVQILEDIFEKIGHTVSYASGSLNITHDWKFRGLKNGNFFNDINFTELDLYIGSLLFDTNNNIKTLSDLLKRLAIEWGCFAGVTKKDEAFFMKLFHFDLFNYQTIDCLDHDVAFKFPRIEYSEAKVNLGTTKIYSHDDRFVTPEIPSGLYFNCLNGFFVNGTILSSVQARVNRGGGDDGLYTITQCKDPNIIIKDRFNNVYEWTDSGNLLAKYWYKYRGKHKSSVTNPDFSTRETHLFKARGIKYNFIKNIAHENGKYRIIRMKKKYPEDLTLIEAIYLGVLTEPFV